ncbi:MAG TPA: FHA domain-containing protein [Bacteriovoracaceae bacterium]|nr:FHA domain-containing protein [Bacteriovoracaceae bacterium]
MSKNVLVLKHFESPKESGSYFRLVCLTGANKGESYILKGTRIVLGRSEKADIRLSDTKASREHAEITYVNGVWVATDLGSQNGIMINEHKLTQKELTEGDKLIIGQTVFKFAKVEVVKTRINIQAKEVEESKRSMMPILILVLILAVMFLFDDSSKPAQKRQGQKATNTYQDVNNEYMTAVKKRQANENKKIKEQLNVIYQRGLREYREGNFFRAIHEFNLALIISPDDAQADYYLRKTREDLDRSIEGFTSKAQRDEESLKYKSAIISYCSIIRLLYSVPDDPRHKNAETQIKDLEAKLGMDSGETGCLKKQRTNQ